MGVARFAKRAGIVVVAIVVAVAGGWLLFPQAARRLAAAGIGELFLRYLAVRSGTGWFEGGVAVEENRFVEMRDGVRLATDLYLPKSPGEHPVIVVRTPYGKSEFRPAGEFFARYGYAVVVQDTRGRHKSEGEFYPFRHEAADGRDLTLWVLKQPWSNGNIGAFGGSYVGFTQWAMAVENPDVAAIAPTFITADLYSGIYSRGAFGKLTFLHWSLSSYGRYGDGRGARNIAKGYSHFPLTESDDAALRDIDFYNDWVNHPVHDEYWRGVSAERALCEAGAPAFLTAGWFDFFRDQQIRDFARLRECGQPAVKAKSRILVGPWSHGFFNANLKNYGIEQRWLEALPFEYVRESKEWYDYALKGVQNGWERRAPYRVFVIGENAWRDESAWPPERASTLTLYLHSGGKAATLRGDGALNETPPGGAEPADVFVYDPAQPVPSVGGSHGDPGAVGPADQREVESRDDVLVYSSEPLKSPKLVMGPVKMTLFASSSAPDTDFTAKLVDVQPDGRALILCEGVVRARYRRGLSAPALLTPGQTERFDIEVGNIAVLFKAGHRIRVEVSSSNFPRYDAHPNTGGAIATERAPVAARQQVYHSAESASALMLPVVR